MPGFEAVYRNWPVNDSGYGYLKGPGEIGNQVRVVSSPVFKTHKPLPRRRHFSDHTSNLRSQFNIAGPETVNTSDEDTKSRPSPSTANHSATPSLLLTPPSLPHEFSDYVHDNSSTAETTILRSGIVTPAPHQSPPTPDITPPRHRPASRPRHFLGTQPSLASTRAESFQTARENMSSDEELEDVHPIPHDSASPKWLQPVTPTSKEQFQTRSSPLAQWVETEVDDKSAHHDIDVPRLRKSSRRMTKRVQSESSTPNGQTSPSPISSHGSGLVPDTNHGQVLDSSVSMKAPDEEPPKATQYNSVQSNLLTPPGSADEDKTEMTQGDHSTVAEDTAPEADSPIYNDSPPAEMTKFQVLRRGQSLRDRLLDSHKVEASPSTEYFANQIGWSRDSIPTPVAPANESEGETDAIAVADADNVPAPSFELRNRVNSWRLSGISTTSTVEAIVVDNEPKRQQTLRHRGRNASLRLASSPTPKSNRNSLISSSDSPHRLVHKKAKLSNQNRWSFGSEVSRSFSMSSNVAPQPKPEVIRVAVIPERTSSLHSSANSSKQDSAFSSASSAGQRSFVVSGTRDSNEPNRHRRSVSESLPSTTHFSGRGRDRRYPPPVPERGSSLSAPTSRNNSRANSISSEHPENLRSRRVAAEEDVRKTLARMESERTIPLVHAQISPSEPLDTPPVEPGTAQWASLRPPSTQNTPFSQPSFHSSSPPVEMGEAKAVNFFPHNNHSLQVIESTPLQESRAVQELYTTARGLQLTTDEPNTPRASLLPMLVVDSPLRNPREPPVPPKFKVIPPTPAAPTPTEELDRQLDVNDPSRKRSKRRFGSLKRPSIATRRRSESFVKSLGRSVSLNAKNKKADQDLDGTLHPFWRPRGFWDDFSESDNEYYDGNQGGDRGIVNNSLGMPQQRTIINGPISLVRHISDSSRTRRLNRGVSKRSSYNSLSRLRASRTFPKVPGLGLRFHVMGLRDLQERMLSVKRRKEDERREKRRQELRSSIGANVISQGDSRFPQEIESVPDAGGIRSGLEWG